MVRPSPVLPVREGDRLAGKYRVERVLGAGGMGIVVAARHEELDQLVAIKFVRDDALSNEEGVQRFLREARAAVKLKSEHVARVLDVGKLESGAPYMVMEFLEGSDLGKVLDEGGPVSLDCAADWVLQACEAVAEAHASGIVHRDLKPENLFLTRTVGGTSKVKVLDFGVSKAVQGSSGELSRLTRTRAMLGSPLYMAPEQMRSSRDVNPTADVWALGVVFFQLLTDRWPFEAETMPELCLKVVTEPPLSLASLRPDVPPDVVGVVERCLQKDPAQRFANAAELASALAPFVQPSSRILADRARLAMEAGRGTSQRSPQSTQVSQSPSGSRENPEATPLPGAAWGTGKTGGSGAVNPKRRGGLLAALALAALVGMTGVVYVTAQRPVARTVSAVAPATASVLPTDVTQRAVEAQPKVSATAPASAPSATTPAAPLPAAAEAVSTTSAVPVRAPLPTSPVGPSHANREFSGAAAKAPIAPARPSVRSPTPDEDIPTIR